MRIINFENKCLIRSTELAAVGIEKTSKERFRILAILTSGTEIYTGYEFDEKSQAMTQICEIGKKLAEEK